MAHHKRGKPKNARAGCLFCKPHKANGKKGMLSAQRLLERRARIDEKEQIKWSRFGARASGRFR
jgi:hypothetical protein